MYMILNSSDANDGQTKKKTYKQTENRCVKNMNLRFVLFICIENNNNNQIRNKN